MSSALAPLDVIVNNPAFKDVLQVVKGGINGALYGAKIRFPHALVMTFLFARQLPIEKKIERIIRATRLHSQNLAKFVFLYKLALLVLKRLNGNTAHSSHYLISGFIMGGYVMGERNEVNMQINLYLLSRITQGLARLALEKANVEAPSYSFRLFAATVWGIVMWLFYVHRGTLQPSLRASMNQLYLDSNSWTNAATFFSL